MMAWTPPGYAAAESAVMNACGTTNQEEAEMDAMTVAVDLAKHVFEVALANRVGQIVERND